MGRLRDAFDGTAPFPVLALVAFVFGLLVLFAELQSPTVLLWTGTRVPATIDGGIAFYRVHGEQYTLDVPGAHGPLGQPRPASVYVDPHDPSTAMLDSSQRWVEAALVGSGFVVSAVLLAVGFGRRARRRRRRQPG